MERRPGRAHAAIDASAIHADNPHRRELSSLTDGIQPSQHSARPRSRVSFATPPSSLSARGMDTSADYSFSSDGLAARSGLSLPGLSNVERGRTNHCASAYDSGRQRLALSESSQPPPQLAAAASASAASAAMTLTPGPRHPYKGEKARPSNRSEAALLSAQLDMALADPSLSFRAEQQLHDHVFSQLIKQVHCGERGELLHKLRRYYGRDKEMTLRAATRAAKQ